MADSLPGEKAGVIGPGLYPDQDRMVQSAEVSHGHVVEPEAAAARPLLVSAGAR